MAYLPPDVGLPVNHARVADLCKLAYTHRTGSLGELEYLLLHEADADYLIFRGTESWPDDTGFLAATRNVWDMVRNLRIWPWPVKIEGIEYRGHAGFIRGARRVAREIRPSLRREMPLVVAGHSLGGAVALVAGLLLGRDQKMVEIVTLGCPRVFWSLVQLPLDTTLTMYRHGRDLVTYVPVGRHPVPQVKLGKAARFWPNISDHRVDHYIAEIRALFGLPK